MMVVGKTKRPWIIEKDKICCEHMRQLTVGIDGPVAAGAKCRALQENSNNSWLFDHQLVYFFYLSLT